MSLLLKVWLRTSVSVFVSECVCAKGVINHDLNVDVAGYENSRSLPPQATAALYQPTTVTFHIRSNQQGKVQMD